MRAAAAGGGGGATQRRQWRLLLLQPEHVRLKLSMSLVAKMLGRMRLSGCERLRQIPASAQQWLLGP